MRNRLIMKKTLRFCGVFCGLALFITGCATPGPEAPEQYEIRLRLTEGETYELTAGVTQTVEQSFLGMDMAVYQDMAFLYRYTVTEIAEDGTIHLDVAYDSFDISMTIDSSAVPPEERDALNDLLNESLEETMTLFEGLTFSVRVTPYGEIESIEGTEALTERLFDTLSDDEVGQQTREILSGIITPEYFNQSWEYMFAYIPGRPVAVGESWESTMSLNQGIVMDVVATYTLASATEDELVIEVVGSVSSGGIDGGPMVQLEAEGIAFEIAVEGTQTGTMRVDAQTGWIVAQQLSMDANADLSFSMEGQTMQIPMRLLSESTVN